MFNAKTCEAHVSQWQVHTKFPFCSMFSRRLRGTELYWNTKYFGFFFVVFFVIFENKEVFVFLYLSKAEFTDVAVTCHFHQLLWGNAKRNMWSLHCVLELLQGVPWGGPACPKHFLPQCSWRQPESDAQTAAQIYWTMAPLSNIKTKQCQAAWNVFT